LRAVRAGRLATVFFDAIVSSTADAEQGRCPPAADGAKCVLACRFVAGRAGRERASGAATARNSVIAAANTAGCLDWGGSIGHYSLLTLQMPANRIARMRA
jgi:hypothetical protein